AAMTSLMRPTTTDTAHPSTCSRETSPSARHPPSLWSSRSWTTRSVTALGDDHQKFLHSRPRSSRHSSPALYETLTAPSSTSYLRYLTPQAGHTIYSADASP